MSNAAAPPTMPAVRDFPDRMPAMVVKELRQGLRARLFGETVAGFHLVLMVIILPVAGFSEPSEAHGIQKLVWWIFAAVLVLLLPLRGLSTLTQERRANTLDTLILTNLNAGRIVWGKWLAIVSQLLLIGISVVPYLFILYAGGGISLPESLVALLRLTLAGMVLTAAYVALSWNDSWLQRAVPGFALAALAMNHFAWPLVADLLQGGILADGLGGGSWRIAGELLAGAAAVVVLLETSAQRLADGGENHQALPRLAVMALPVIGLLTPWPLMTLSSLVLLALVSLTAMTEPWPRPRPLEKSWKSWPSLAPGWPHGVLWAVAAWALALGVDALRQSGQAAPLVALALWLFGGRLLLWCGPAAWRNRSWMLAGTGLLFLIGYLLVVLAGNFLATSSVASVATPASGDFFGTGGNPPHVIVLGFAGGSALLCAVIAIIALARHRAACRKENNA